MQKTLYIDLDRNLAVNAAGNQLAARPVLVLGEQPEYRITLGRMAADSSGETVFAPEDLSGIMTWRLSVDKDFAASTAPMCRSVMADGIDVAGAATGVIVIPVDTQTESFFAAVDGRDYLNCWMQLAGWDAAGRLAVFVRLPWSAWGNIDYDGVTAVVPQDTLSGSALRAILAAGVELQYSATGGSDAGHTEQAAADRFWRWRSTGIETAQWSPWITMVAGPQGVPGIAPHIDPASKHWMVGEVDTGVVAGITTGAGAVTFATDANTGDTVVITSAQLGIEDQCEFDLINPDGYNVTADARLSRRWTSAGYELVWAGGWPVGTWTLRPHGITGPTGEIAAVPISTHCFYHALYGVVAYLDDENGLEFVGYQYPSLRKLRLLVVSADDSVTGNAVLTVAGQRFVAAVGAAPAEVELTLSPAVGGLVTIERDTSDTDDTLKDGDDQVVTALVIGWRALL